MVLRNLQMNIKQLLRHHHILTDLEVFYLPHLIEVRGNRVIDLVTGDIIGCVLSKQYDVQYQYMLTVVEVEARILPPQHSTIPPYRIRNQISMNYEVKNERDFYINTITNQSHYLSWSQEISREEIMEGAVNN